LKVWKKEREIKLRFLEKKKEIDGKVSITHQIELEHQRLRINPPFIYTFNLSFMIGKEILKFLILGFLRKKKRTKFGCGKNRERKLRFLEKKEEIDGKMAITHQIELKHPR
jgi:hypothetical protein